MQNKPITECDSFGSLVSRTSFNRRSYLSAGEKLILQVIHHVNESMVSFVQLGMAFDQLATFTDVRSETQSGYHRPIWKVEGKSSISHSSYFSRDDGSIIHRMKAKFISARAMSLHLMCESIHEPHFVGDQRGLKVYLEKDGRFPEWIRTLSVISLNMMIWVVLRLEFKLGQVWGGWFLTSQTSLREFSVGIYVATVDVVLDQLKVELDKNLTLMNEGWPDEEASCGVRNYLAEYLTPEKFASLFRLHLIT